MNYLLRMYATEENIADTKNKIATFVQPPIMTPSQHAEAFVARTICSEDVYKEQAFNEIFIKRLDKSIWQIMVEYSYTRETASFHNSAFAETLFLGLKGGY